MAAETTLPPELVEAWRENAQLKVEMMRQMDGAGRALDRAAEAVERLTREMVNG